MRHQAEHSLLDCVRIAADQQAATRMPFGMVVMTALGTQASQSLLQYFYSTDHQQCSHVQ